MAKKQYEDKLREAIGQGPRRKLRLAIERKIDDILTSMSHGNFAPSEQLLTLAKALAYVQVQEEKELQELNAKEDIDEIKKDVKDLKRKLDR